MSHTGGHDSGDHDLLALYTLAFLGPSPFGALVLGAIASVLTTATAIALWGVCGLAFSGSVLLH
ncbi:MAG TPA: hypothetical protein VMT34_17490 [Aggregatilineales bacterium]|nr:hypothetical protein [Aggregatilineales bacterium]